MIEAELIERLQRLERANQRLWFVAVGALVLLTAVIGFRAVYAAPATPQKITAHEFDVVDNSGKARIKLYVDKYGSPFISVIDRAGVTQATVSYNRVAGPEINLGFHKVGRVPPGLKSGLGMTPDVSIGDSPLGPMVMLTAPGATLGPGVGIGVTRKGQPNVTLMDAKGRERASIFLLADAPSFEFFNESGRDTVRLTSLSNGASLEFMGSQDQKIGKYSFPVDRMQLSTWGLYFDDSDGTSALSLGGLKAGAPDTTRSAIELSDAAGYSMDLGTTNTITPTTGQTQQTSAASIVMFGNDKNHHVIWRAPQ